LADPYQGQVFVIDKDEFVIGRANNCDLAMPQSTISGRHAKIQKVADHYEIFDLQSTNGTFLNGLKVERKHLRSEDKIKFDKYEFQFINPADVGRTIIRPAADEIAKTVAGDRAALEAAQPQAGPATAKKGSLLAGLIVGLVVSVVVGLVGNTVLSIFQMRPTEFSLKLIGPFFKAIALGYPGAHLPQVWFKQNWADWRTIVTLGLILVAIFLGGILTQAIGRKARGVSALVFSLFYVIVALLVQMIVLRFSIHSLPSLYPSLGQSLGPWANYGLASGLFFVVVLVVSFLGTLLAKRR